jgi:hypothetical protein
MRRWICAMLRESLDAGIRYRQFNWIFVPAAAVAGGAMFTISGSWLTAVRWDAFAFLVFWVCLPPAILIANATFRLLLFILGGDSIQAGKP